MSDQSEYPLYFPIACEVEAGKIYRWCGCKLSQTQPFCDRSDCTQFVEFKAKFSETVSFCNCKETRDPPFCDGSHARLLIEYMRQKKNTGM